jgi:hypothetical protein
MDKETAERLVKLETKLEAVEQDRAVWNKLIRDAIIKTVSWLVMVGTAGMLYGWHMPENVRKFVSEWVSK